MNGEGKFIVLEGIDGSGLTTHSRRLFRWLEGKGKLICAQPNAGLPEVVDGETVYHETAEQMAESAVELATVGARLIGGCCGSTPEFIAAVKEKLGL